MRESGARISAGQAVVRNLPWLLELFWIDALFALFTDKRQRAFEMLSKTRVVRMDAAIRAERPSAHSCASRGRPPSSSATRSRGWVGKTRSVMTVSPSLAKTSTTERSNRMRSVIRPSRQRTGLAWRPGYSR